jgi:hypothetical protein
MTWPLAARTTIIDAGDSAYFAWALGWQVHALKTDIASLPHGNVYAPFRYALFMDEPVLGTGMFVWPLGLFTPDAIWLFNVARLLTFVLTAVFTWRLLRELGTGSPAALAGGAFFAFSPIRVDQIAHLSTLGTQWIPLAYLFALRTFLDPKPFPAALTGAAFGLSVLACGYHGVFFAVLFPLSLLPLAWLRPRALGPRQAGPALLTAATLLAPAYFLHLRALEPLGFARSREDTLRFAASIETFFSVSRFNRFWGDTLEPFRGAANNLFPTATALLLALALVAHGFRSRHPALSSIRGGFVATTALLGTAAALVSLGPEIRLFDARLGPGPFALLRDALPMFQNIRATSRAGIFVAFSLAILGAWTLSRRKPSLTFLALAAFLVEARIAPIPTPSWTNVIDSRDEVPPVYEWLRKNESVRMIAEYPMRGAGDLSRPGLHDSIYMVWSTQHWKSLVNGFAGVQTPLIARLRSRADAFPDAASLDDLRQAGVTHVVLHLRGYGPAQRLRLDDRLREMASDLRPVFETESDTVLVLRPATGPSPRDRQ